jgi:acyl carrier protein
VNSSDAPAGVGLQIAVALEEAGHGDEPLDLLLLSECDSLLVAEMIAIVEDAVGRTVEPEAFSPEFSSVADLLRFAEQVGER